MIEAEEDAEEDAEVSPCNLQHAFTNQLSVSFGTFLLGRDFLGDVYNING